MSIAIGIDVSKETLQIDDGEHNFSIKNTAASLIKAFVTIEKPAKIVLEATGKHHRLAHRVLCELGYAVMVVNPRQSAHFAKALNWQCKTDKVDARMLCCYAAQMPFKATALLSKGEETCQALVRCLLNLRKTYVQYSLRRQGETGLALASTERMLSQLKKEMSRVNQDLLEQLNLEPKYTEKLELLCSIPGIGKKTAVILICLLRELGALSKNQVAALAGLAPINRDSGKSIGRRSIAGGRHDVRSELYLPVVGAATQHNRRLQEFYDRLIAKGKPAKVALTACMRKLLIWANAILAMGKTWEEGYV